jgi:hypothetical protein
MKRNRYILTLLIGTLFFSCSEQETKNANQPNIKNNRFDDMNKPRKRFIQLEDGEVIHYVQIPKTEADNLIASQEVTSLESKDSNEQLYKLTNGSILVRQNYGGCYIYNSLEQLDRISESTAAFYDKMAEDPNYERHLLTGIFSQSEDFPNHSRELSIKLLDHWKITDQTWDENMLKTLDEKIMSEDDPIDTYRQNFEALIAIVGEVLKEQYKAKWTMQKTDAGNTWQPYMEIKGIKLEYYNWLYEDIFINQDPEKPIAYETYMSAVDWIKVKTGDVSLR